MQDKAVTHAKKPLGELVDKQVRDEGTGGGAAGGGGATSSGGGATDLGGSHLSKGSWADLGAAVGAAGGSRPGSAAGLGSNGGDLSDGDLYS